MPVNKKLLEAEFESELLAACDKVENHLHRHNLTIRTLIQKYGAVKAATELVMHPKIHDGFVDLLLLGKSHLTVEYIICKKKYFDLFPEEIRNKAWEKVGFVSRAPKNYFKKKPIFLNRFR